jgi:hypothetical protein
MSMRRRWLTRISRGSRPSRTASTLLQKRRGGWRATPVASSCATTRTARSRRSAPGRGRLRRRYAERCSIVIAAVDFRVADRATRKAITSATGRWAGPPSSRTSCCCAAGTTSLGARGRLSGGATGRRGVQVPASGRVVVTRGAAADRRARQCRRRPRRTEHRGRRSAGCQYTSSRLGRDALRHALCHRCHAPAGNRSIAAHTRRAHTAYSGSPSAPGERSSAVGGVQPPAASK